MRWHAQGAKVDEEVAKRKERRQKKRTEALQKWELANPERKQLIDGADKLGCDAGSRLWR